MQIIIRDKQGNLISGYYYEVNAAREQIGTRQNFSNGVVVLYPSQPGQLFLFAAPGFASFVSSANELENDNVIELEKDNDLSGNSFILVAGVAGLLLFKNQKNKKTVIAKIDTKEIGPVLWIGGGLIAFMALKKVLTLFGIIDSQATTDLNNQSTNPQSFWNPTYYKNFSSYSYAIDTTTAQQYVQQILDSFGAFNDNEEQAIAVFHQLKTKANVSFLAEIFYRMTGQDLLTYLRGGIWPQDRLSDSDVNAINQFLSKLPNN
jgi:hypothetical protein